MSHHKLQVTADLMKGERVSDLRTVTLSNSSASRGDKSNSDKLLASDVMIQSNPDKMCICERPKTKVFCRSCGFFQEEARVRTMCKRHPQIFYLYDMDTCPKCMRMDKLREVCPLTSDIEQIKQSCFKQEVPLKIDLDLICSDPSKNLFKRTTSAVSTLSANVSRKANNYRYRNNNFNSGAQKFRINQTEF